MDRDEADSTRLHAEASKAASLPTRSMFCSEVRLKRAVRVCARDTVDVLERVECVGERGWCSCCCCCCCWLTCGSISLMNASKSRSMSDGRDDDDEEEEEDGAGLVLPLRSLVSPVAYSIDGCCCCGNDVDVDVEDA